MRSPLLNETWFPKLCINSTIEISFHIAWSPDGKKIGAVLYNKELFIWDIENGFIVSAFNSEEFGATSFCWSPDSKKIAIGTESNKVIIWDLSTNKEIATIKADPVEVISVSWSPDGNFIASGSDQSNKAIIWNAQTMEKVKELTTHESYINDSAWTFDSSKLATASNDATIKIWSVGKWEECLTLKGHKLNIFSIAWHPTRDIIASGSTDTTIRLWDIKTGKQINVLKGHKNAISSVSWNKDGTRLVSSADDATIIIWAVKEGILLRKIIKGHTKFVTAKYSPDGVYIASGSHDKTLKIWEKQELVDYIKYEAVNAVASIEWDSQGEKVIAALDDGNVIIWNIKNGLIKNFKKHKDITYTGGWNPDNTRICTSSWKEPLMIWDPINGNNFCITEVYPSNVYSVAWSPNGKYIATGYDDGAIIIWDALNGIKKYFLKDHTDTVHSLTWSPDSSHLISGSLDKLIKVWEIKEREGFLLTTLKQHTGGVRSVHWSYDGKRLASGSSDTKIIIWDTNNWKPIFNIKENDSEIYSVKWSHNCSCLATGAKNGTVRIWNAIDGKLLRTFYLHKEIVNQVIWSPDDLQIASGSEDYSLIVCKVSSIVNDFLKLLFLTNSLDADTYLTIKESIELKKIKCISDLIEKAFPMEAAKRLGESGYLPAIMKFVGNAPMQKEFLLGLRSSGRLAFWAYLEFQTQFQIPSTNLWTISLYKLSEVNGLKIRQEIKFSDKEHIQKNLYITDRRETVLNFQLVVENVPFLMHPLISSVLVSLRTDRGDIYELRFTDFYFDYNPNNKLPEFQSKVTFKIDSGYSGEPIARITITEVKIEFDEFLIPKQEQKLSQISYIFKEINELKENIFNLNNFIREETTILKNIVSEIIPKNDKVPGMSSKSLCNELKHNSMNLNESNIDTKEEEMSMEILGDPSEWITMFDAFKQSWREPNFPLMQIKIGKGMGNYFGKWADYLLAGLIVGGSLPNIIQFFMRCYLIIFMNIDKLPLIWEIFSYFPIIGVIFYLTFQFYKSQKLK